MKNPKMNSVIFDIYLDVIFLAEIICTFFIPYTNDQSRIVTDHKKIACRYMSTWFLLEVMALVPFSMLKYNSRNWPNNKDDL